ncbi:SEL1-like repeat protein [Pelagibius marinus]|uniref:SEL1-like repeat protein n=1 Tax=Pelagibius marinus TaxID=2762760 RepID=UPI001872365F|nr:SEL1-like repeat protein [Pelagibius marinus]
MKISTGIAKPLSVVAALFLVGIGGFACTDVKDTLDDADQTLSGALGANDPELAGLSGTELSEATYQKGLSLRNEGKNEDAFTYFLDAAERGHGPAAYETGEAYNAGLGVEKDLNAGAKWINAAAARGEPRAQYAVGAALYNGAGVEQDYARAARYLGNAASQGHAGAQYLLGECYANGRGVTKNLSWAARWYGKAAMQGHADGAFSYGVVQAAGLGLPKNLTSGYAWLDIASNRGHGKAGEVRAAIANKMTPAQIETAKKRADAFSPTNSAEFADLPTVMYVQHSLNQLGFNAGTVDGLSGPRTRSAIGAYLSSVGMEGEADITPDLLQKLFEGQQAGASSA